MATGFTSNKASESPPRQRPASLCSLNLLSGLRSLALQLLPPELRGHIPLLLSAAQTQDRRPKTTTSTDH